MKRFHPPRAAIVFVVVAWTWGAATLQAADRPVARIPVIGQLREMPGEFEKTGAILLGWEEDDHDIQNLQLRMIAAISKHAPVLLMVRNAGEHHRVLRRARKLNVALTAVTIRSVPFNSIWARDYGPLFLRLSANRLPAQRIPVQKIPVQRVAAVNPRPARPTRQYLVVDMEYPEIERPDDDVIPEVISQLSGVPIDHVPICLQGGNLLSNGAGLYLTTRKTITENALFDRKQTEVVKVLKASLGATELVFLEELVGEPNGHVDMFATFTSANTVVVGEYSAKDDAVNAAILNRNAARLSAVRTPAGALRVVRIPMPKRKLDLWPTYTNVLHANGVMLMPTYPGIDPAAEAKARNIYKMLMPKVKIVDIDCGKIIESGGALHCMTMNLPIAPSKARFVVPPPRPGRRMIVAAAAAPRNPFRNQRWPRGAARPADNRRIHRGNPFVTTGHRMLLSLRARLIPDNDEPGDMFRRDSDLLPSFRRNVRDLKHRFRKGVQTGLELMREQRVHREAESVEAMRVAGDEYESDLDLNMSPGRQP